MKILNSKICLLLISALFVGCVPDSLTKFKKDAETKPAAPPASTIITTEEGETFDLADVENIQNFYYVDDNNNLKDTFTSKVNDELTMLPTMDGTYGIAPSTLKSRLFVSCSISPALPYGLTISSKSDSPCKIEGTPTAKSFVNVSGQMNAPITYTVTLRTRGTNGAITNSVTQVKIGVYEDVVPFSYHQDDLVILKSTLATGASYDDLEANINPTATYLSNGFVTSSNGITGVVKSIDKEQQIIGVKKLLPLRLFGYTTFEGLVGSFDENVGLRDPMFICGQNGAVAKVIRVPKTFSSEIIHVEMISSTKFLRGSANRIALIKPSPAQLLANSAEAQCTVSAPTYSAPIYILPEIIKYNFPTTLTALDFNLQFFQQKADLVRVELAYEINRTIGSGVSFYPAIVIDTISPLKMTNADNGVVYTVSPSLPAGFSISPTTGELTGTFTTQFNQSTFNITASNPISSQTTVITLNSLYAPRELSLTTNQLFSINRLDEIHEGIKLEESVTPPLAADQAKITKVINKYSDLAESISNRYKLSVNTPNGKIKYLSLIKIPNSLVTEIPMVNANNVISYNVALPVTGVIPPSYTVGGYIKAPNDALARITYVLRNPNRSVIFAQQIKLNSDLSMPRFSLSQTPAADRICLTTADRTGCQDLLTLHSVEANNLVLETDVVPALATQFQFHANENSSSGKLENYATNLYLFSDIGQSPQAPVSADFPQTNSHYLKAGQTLRYLSPSDADVSSAVVTKTYAAANIFILERDQYSEIQPNLLNETYSNFIISPPLPSGLTLNTSTGVISGTPLVRNQRSKYTVTAMNLVGQSSFDIELEIKDYFKVKNINQISSQNMHLAGKNKSTRECKIDVNEITKRGFIGTADIFDTSCMLDVEESDLFNRGINLQVSVGDAICHDVEFEPYSFFQYTPITTGSTAIVNYYKASGCTSPPPAGYIVVANPPDPASNAVCGGNYTSSMGPNCDSGSVYFTETSWIDNAGVCTLDSTTTSRIDCGGSKYNCRQGAIRDVIADTDIANNVTKVYNSSWDTGVKVSYPIKAPKDLGLMSNLHLANSITNVCTSSRVNTQALLNFANITSESSSPLGQSSPYYSFYCKNASGSTLARIKVLVREWDLNYYLTSFIDTFNPDTSLALPALNNSSPSGYGGSTYNDYNSWDNMITASPAPLACVSGADTTPIADRYRYPGQDY